TIARTHRAGVELATVAVVVAHLHGLREALGRIAAGAGPRLDADHRIAFHVPCGPVELRLERDALIARGKPEERGVVHLRRRDDLARIHAIAWIEHRLHLGEGLGHPRTELPGDPFAATQPIAVLARIRALVLADQRGGFLGDRAHLGGAVTAHV